MYLMSDNFIFVGSNAPLDQGFLSGAKTNGSLVNLSNYVKISFPEDSSGWQRQKDILESEGVVFLNGKVDLERFGYRGAVDRLLWGDEGL